MEHYCDQCTNGTHEGDDMTEWCCGGDTVCDAAEPEPSCPRGAAHNWSRDTGGCTENPGVWALGGTTYMFKSRCTLCGMERTEKRFGSQRNPGDCDSVHYETDVYPVERHYREADGISGYHEGDILVCDDTGARSRVVRDGRGLVLEPL